MEIGLILLILALVGVSAPISVVGGAWYFELWKWSIFWNKRFGRPFFRGLIYDSAMNFIGFFIKTQKSVAGNPTLYSNDTWGSFARPTRPTQYFKHGLETRLIYRVDLSEAARYSNEYEPVELIFGDDPKTNRRMQESASIEKLTRLKKSPINYTMLMVVILVVLIVGIVAYFLMNGGGG
jgi:membrane protease YdiL (CAAX protease family)